MIGRHDDDDDYDDRHLWEEARAEERAAHRICPECMQMGGHNHGCPNDDDDGGDDDDQPEDEPADER